MVAKSPPPFDPDAAAAAIVATTWIGVHPDPQQKVLRSGSFAFSAENAEAGRSGADRLQQGESSMTVTDAWMAGGAFAIGGAVVRLELHNSADVAVTLTDIHVAQTSIAEPTALAIIGRSGVGGGDVYDLAFDLDEADPQPRVSDDRSQLFFDLKRPDIAPHSTLSLTLRLFLDRGATEARLQFDFVASGHPFSKTLDSIAPIRVAAFQCGAFLAHDSPVPSTSAYDRVIELGNWPERAVERVPPFVREDASSLAMACPSP